MPETTVPETTVPATTQAEPVTLPQSLGYVMPVDPQRASYAKNHHDYPASDIFVVCGAAITSPTNATVLEVRRVDAWVKATDNPATRGGKSVSLLGDDGVRYYLAHFDSIADNFNLGDHIPAGFALGEMGETGRAGACHLHFAISPPCPGKEWSVRRGVIWPWPYLDAWRSGTALSPADEVALWSADHPGACEDAMSDPNAANS